MRLKSVELLQSLRAHYVYKPIRSAEYNKVTIISHNVYGVVISLRDELSLLCIFVPFVQISSDTAHNNVPSIVTPSQRSHGHAYANLLDRLWNHITILCCEYVYVTSKIRHCEMSTVFI